MQDLSREEGQLVRVLARSRDPDGARPVPVQVTELERQPGDSEWRGCQCSLASWGLQDCCCGDGSCSLRQRRGPAAGSCKGCKVKPAHGDVFFLIARDKGQALPAWALIVADCINYPGTICVSTRSSSPARPPRPALGDTDFPLSHLQLALSQRGGKTDAIRLLSLICCESSQLTQYEEQTQPSACTGTCCPPH